MVRSLGVCGGPTGGSRRVGAPKGGRPNPEKVEGEGWGLHGWAQRVELDPRPQIHEKTLQERKKDKNGSGRGKKERNFRRSGGGGGPGEGRSGAPMNKRNHHTLALPKWPEQPSLRLDRQDRVFSKFSKNDFQTSQTFSKKMGFGIQILILNLKNNIYGMVLDPGSCSTVAHKTSLLHSP